MDDQVWTAVDRYVEKSLIPHDEALTGAASRSESAGLPSIAVTAAHGRMLNLMAKMQEPLPQECPGQKLSILRPDWPTRSLKTLLARPELANRPRRDVTVALAWVACESGTATPARVLESGPWWKAAAIDSNNQPLEHLAPHERCRTCSKSQPQCARNPWAEHAFEPDIHTPRDYDIAPVITELKGNVARVTQTPQEETA